jgi:ATP-dependent DNA helicase RecQ
VVNDYTIDFVGANFEVSFHEKTDNSVFSGLHTYISKYEPISKAELLTKVNSYSDSNLTARSLRYLIYWIYDNIAYERRQALKGIADLCRNFQNSTDFKRQIVAYFDVNEITVLLQHISDHPFDYEKWFDVFVKRNQKYEVIGSILGNRKEMENLKLKLQRFLESYKNNTGLNFLSGIIRLFLNEFEDQDGRIRFDQALDDLNDNFSSDHQDEIMNRVLKLGIMLDTNGRNTLSNSILSKFPHYSQQFYYTLGDNTSLNFTIKSQTIRIRNINSTLYGEFAGPK